MLVAVVDGKTGGQRLLTISQRRQERRVGRVGLQQLRAEAVDQQQADTARLGNVQRVGRPCYSQTGQHGRQQLGE